MMSKQEMFDKAVKGLASQGFERCVGDAGGCTYSNEAGTKHCAWGWIDTSLDREEGRYFYALRNDRIGIAGTLDEDHAEFAASLQQAHDSAADPLNVKANLVNLAMLNNLAIPEELKKEAV